MIVNKNLNNAVNLIKYLVSIRTQSNNTVSPFGCAQTVYNLGRKLVAAGLLGSKRGRNGGYYLAASTISVGDVARAVLPLTHECNEYLVALDGMVLWNESSQTETALESIEESHAADPLTTEQN